MSQFDMKPGDRLLVGGVTMQFGWWAGPVAMALELNQRGGKIRRLSAAEARQGRLDYLNPSAADSLDARPAPDERAFVPGLPEGVTGIVLTDPEQVRQLSDLIKEGAGE